MHRRLIDSHWGLSRPRNKYLSKITLNDPSSCFFLSAEEWAGAYNNLINLTQKKKNSPWFLSKNDWFHWLYKQEDFHAWSRSQCLSFLELLSVSATSEEDEKRNFKVHLTSFKQGRIISVNSRSNCEARNYEFLNTDTPVSFRSQNGVLFWRDKPSFALKRFLLFV